MSTISPEVLQALQACVGESRVLTDADSLERYGRDWTRVHTPAPSAVVLPGSIEEVQALVEVALARQLVAA